MKPPCLPDSIRYLGQIGKGGTALVARVCVDELNREAALKYPDKSGKTSDSEFLKLAAREQALVGSHRFPGLVRLIHQTVECPDFLLMELCNGPTLDQVGRIDNLNTALNIISALAANLHYLNICGIVHGDLKPQNIFLPTDWKQCFHNHLFYVKLSDFSLGRLDTEPEDARAGIGTVGYAAPETLSDNKCDHRSDLFSLGVISYQTLTGQHPFIDPNDPDPVRTNSRLQEVDPPPPKELRPDISSELSELVMNLLHRDPAGRPESARHTCMGLASVGATYPFKKAIRPKHLIIGAMDYDGIKTRLLDISPAQSDRLDRLTDGNPRDLRLLLEHNFQRGNLLLDKTHFRFVNDIYWPCRMRRQTLTRYSEGSFSLKRDTVKAAVAGGLELVNKLGCVSNSGHNVAPALVEIVLPLLKPKTVKIISSELAARAEQSGLHEHAARLYLQAGELEAAERNAYVAAIELNKAHEKHQALQILESVIRFANLTHRRFSIRQLLMCKGDILKESGDSEQALEVYETIISLYRNHQADKLLAETYKDLGDLYKIKQDLKAGQKSLDEAMRIYSLLGDELEISHCLNNIGNLHWIGSEYDEALKSYRRALRIQRRLQALDNVASTLSNIAKIFALRGRLVRSTLTFKLSVDICRKTANELEEARILNNLGYVYQMRGMLDNAVSTLERSLEINRKIGARKEILFNLENLTIIMIGMGRLKHSITYLQEGMKLAGELNDQPHLAAFTGDMGVTLKRMGRYSEAKDYYNQAKKLYSEIEDPIGLARLEIGRADLRHKVGDIAEAIEIATEIMKQRAAASNKPQELEALVLLTRLSDNPDYLSRARALASELKLERESLLIEFNALGQRLKQTEVRPDADEYMNLIEGLTQRHNDIELPWMNNLAAELMLKSDQVEKAESFLARSIHLAAEYGLNPELITAHILFGKMHLQMNNYEEAFDCYRKALENARRISDGITDPKDKALYQNLPRNRFLVDEIKRLARTLT